MVLQDGLVKWIENIIRKEWKCCLTLRNGDKIIGIPIKLENNLDITFRSPDIDNEEILGTYSLNDCIQIESVENRLNNSILY